MTISIVRFRVPDYDNDDFSQPWIGRVVQWDDMDQLPLLEYGGFTRTHPGRRGSGGVLEIAAPTDGLVRWGQGSRRRDVPPLSGWGWADHRGFLRSATLAEAWRGWRTDAPTVGVAAGEYEVV